MVSPSTQSKTLFGAKLCQVKTTYEENPMQQDLKEGSGKRQDLHSA
jgi:hypothetical protein